VNGTAEPIVEATSSQRDRHCDLPTDRDDRRASPPDGTSSNARTGDVMACLKSWDY
jgi:hypothetical protein